METADNLELIAKYLHGELSSEEQATFDHQIQDDPEFEEEVEMALTLFTHEKVKQKKEWENLLQSQELSPQPPQSNSKSPFIEYLKWAAILLVLITIPAIIWWANKAPTPTNLAILYVNQLECPFTQQMGARPGQEVAWKEAISLCQSGNYEAGIQKLSPLVNSGNPVPRIQLLLSYFYLRTGDYPRAISLAETLIETKGHRHTEAATWHQAIGYILSDQPEKARPALQSLVDAKAKDWPQAEKMLKALMP